jgi:hypothetical protein
MAMADDWVSVVGMTFTIALNGGLLGDMTYGGDPDGVTARRVTATPWTLTATTRRRTSAVATAGAGP